MKRLKPNNILIAFILFTSLIYAQADINFGIKAGLNYNTNGDFVQSINSSTLSPDRAIGYHAGVFSKIGNTFYLKPEIFYTKTNSDYKGSNFETQKIDAPMLIGLKVFGPVSVFGGPAFQYIIDSKFEELTVSDIENDFSVGVNLGIAVQIKKISIDLRYERGLEKNEATIVNNNTALNITQGRLDTRPEQLILSVSLSL